MALDGVPTLHPVRRKNVSQSLTVEKFHRECLRMAEFPLGARSATGPKGHRRAQRKTVWNLFSLR